MTIQTTELLALGAGPSNLALAVALEELAPHLAKRCVVAEQHGDVRWHRGTLMPGTLSQVSFLKDLATQRNPRSRFTFLNYLREQNLLDAFINLGTFTPYRQEISDYLQWVARQFDHVQVRYHARAEAITPDYDPAGRVRGWTTRFTDGRTLTSRHLVMGVGRDPNVPAVFRGVRTDRVVHSSAYLHQTRDLLGRPALRIAVVGGAQSAAELYRAALQDWPDADVRMIMRSIGLVAYEGSRFTNELFYASFVDDFYSCEPGTREAILAEMHRTNYGGVAPSLLDELYRLRYQRIITGQGDGDMLTMTDIVDARDSADGVLLTLKDKRTGAVQTLEVDLVLLGTGFSPQLPQLLAPLAQELGLDALDVSRHYRVQFGQFAGAGLYVQGINEATHGIADSLLSVLAARSEEIVMDLLALQDDPALPPARDLIGA